MTTPRDPDQPTSRPDETPEAPGIPDTSPATPAWPASDARPTTPTSAAPETPPTERPSWPATDFGSTAAPAPPPAGETRAYETPVVPPPAEPPPGEYAPPPPPPARRSGPSARWIVAGVATLLVLLAAIAVVWFAGRSPAPAATSYLPPSTLGYVEMRLDLPGTQREKAAEFLANFPGFADRAALEAKLDDTLDRLVRQATDQAYSYTGELKPWFNGQISLAVIDIPIPAPGATDPEPPRVAVLLGVKDRQKAQEVVDRLSAEAREKGARLTSEAYAGTTIWTVEPPGPAPGEEEPSPSPEGSAIPEMPELGEITTGFALTDDVLILATPASEVKTALDQRAAGGGLAEAEAFKAATAGLPEDRIGAFYFGTQSLRELLEQSAEDADLPPGTMDELLRSFPESLVGVVRLDSDRIIAEIRADLPEGADPVVPRDSGLAARVPAETAVFVEVPGVGESIGRAVGQIKQDPSLGEEVTAGLEQVEALLGAKLEDYLDWVGDAAVAVEFDGDQPSGGLVATVSDEAMATQRLDQLSALLRLGGASMGGGVVVGTEEYAGTTITTVTVDAAMAGVEATGEVGVSWAIKDDLFVLSPDLDYLKVILDAPEGSLADSQRFRDALAAVGGPSTAGLSYLDIAALRGIAEGMLSPEDSDRYEREVQPYAQPLDILISAYVAEEGVDVFNRTLLIVKSEE